MSWLNKMDISIRRIFQLCAALVVVAVIYRAGNAGLDTPSASKSALWSVLHTLIAPLARVYLSMFSSPATAILLSGGLVLAGILLVLWFVFLKVRPALSQLDRLTAECARATGRIGRRGQPRPGAGRQLPGSGLARVAGRPAWRPSVPISPWHRWSAPLRTGSDAGAAQLFRRAGTGDDLPGPDRRACGSPARACGPPT